MSTNRKYKYQPHRIPRHNNECLRGNVKLENLDLTYDPLADPNSTTHEREARRLEFKVWQQLGSAAYEKWWLETHKRNTTWLEKIQAAQMVLDNYEKLDTPHATNLDEAQPDFSIGNQ